MLDAGEVSWILSCWAVQQTRHSDARAIEKRARRLLVAALVLILWGFGTHGTNAGTGDEPHYLAIAHSLAFDRDLDVRNNYGSAEPLIAGGNLVPASHVRETADGLLRPVHDVGLPLLAVPYVRLAAPLTSWIAQHAPERMMRAARLTPTTLYRHVISLAMIACAAVLAVLMFDSLMMLGASHRAAFATTLLLVTAPPLLAYSILFFTELLSALLAFFAFVTLMWRRDSRLLLLAAGIATGFLLLVHIRNVGLVIGLTLVAAFLWRGESRRQASGFFVGLVAMVVLRTAINHYLWGTWITTPHATAGSWEGFRPTVGEAAMRMVALLVDQQVRLAHLRACLSARRGGDACLHPASASPRLAAHGRRDVLRRARAAAGHESARMVGAVVPRRSLSDADAPTTRAADPFCDSRGAAQRPDAGHRTADFPERLVLAKPEAVVERRRWPRRVLRADGTSSLRVVTGAWLGEMKGRRMKEEGRRKKGRNGEGFLPSLLPPSPFFLSVTSPLLSWAFRSWTR